MCKPENKLTDDEASLLMGMVEGRRDNVLKDIKTFEGEGDIENAKIDIEFAEELAVIYDKLIG